MPIAATPAARCAPLKRQPDRPPVRLGAQQARPWRAALHRPARPLRPDPDRLPLRQRRLRGGRPGAAGKRHHRHRPGRAARGGHGEREAADRRDRAARLRHHGAVGRRRAADAGRRRRALPRRDPPQIPLHRPAPREDAAQHEAARGRHRLHPPPHDRQRLHRVPDPDPDRLQPRGRARLPRPLAQPPRQVLRPAAGAAAVQAARHGRRPRPLLPDRPLLPRRGQPPTARPASSTSSISR